ncbi:4-hydroxy-3-methylbut-2-enyl diphosphate reductase [Stieleria marina]|uniref:4-hydroxy-3-methylbut-2-enyl diphosphate reductase n=1 Tax=Stieleria marina TaxID=1930275 RepID=A0A517NQ29_9BACT|nr:4-hydroxy-3-methylbut-2-enyl diphosphate reductase [Planctomycetes bacterium K23_9]
MTQIIRAEHMGFCFGVRDAFQAAQQATQPQKTAIYGELVHNTDVTDALEQREFQLLGESDRDSIPERPIVMVTAHGISDRRRNLLQSSGKELLDTTCPLVRRVHQAATALIDRDHFVVLIGSRNHVEVQGIIEDLPANRCAVVADASEVANYGTPKIGIIAQTTIPDSIAQECRDEIAKQNHQASIRWTNTICRPTRQRQNAVDQLCQKVGLVIVVGGKNSNNTQRLLQRCLSHNVEAYHVQSADELRTDWFVGHQRIGLTAGTSTPDTTIDAVEQELRRITSVRGRRMQRDQVWCDAWSNRDWADYFYDNMNHPPTVAWSKTPTLSATEKAAVIASIQTFQLGESGEGRHICRAAKNWTDRGGDEDYLSALKLFLQEENCHAAWLEKFLQQEGEAILTHHWSDHCFRSVRHLAGLRTSIMVLLTAEILAQVYYLALLRSTDSPTLRTICQRILRDERAHVQFQQNQANVLASRWSRGRRWLVSQAESIGFQIARRIVWHDHRSVFVAAGMNWKAYRDRTSRRWLSARRVR